MNHVIDNKIGFIYEGSSTKMSRKVFATSVDRNQSAHPRSLICLWALVAQNSLCGEAASCFESMLCGELV